MVPQLLCAFRIINNFRLCINTLGCSSIGFRETEGRMGNCAIIAPTDTALNADDIPDGNHPDWKYINVEKRGVIAN